MTGRTRALNDVTVIVPTLATRKEWLRQCLTSIQRQSPTPRILIVTPSHADLSDVLARHPGAIWLTDDTPGLSNAINTGLREVRTPLATWLGDDDLLAPNSIAIATQVLEDHPAASFVYGRTRYIDQSGKTLGYTRPSRLAAWYLKYGKDFVPQPGSLFRSVALEEVGGVDASLRNAMDLDMFIRLQSWGPAIYVPRELSAYRLHDSSITMTKGLSDEADLVRLRHQSPTAKRINRAVRPLTRQLDTWFDRSFRYAHAPKPPIWAAGGGPYTSRE